MLLLTKKLANASWPSVIYPNLFGVRTIQELQTFCMQTKCWRLQIGVVIHVLLEFASYILHAANIMKEKYSGFQTLKTLKNCKSCLDFWKFL